VRQVHVQYNYEIKAQTSINNFMHVAQARHSSPGIDGTLAEKPDGCKNKSGAWRGRGGSGMSWRCLGVQPSSRDGHRRLFPPPDRGTSQAAVLQHPDWDLQQLLVGLEPGPQHPDGDLSTQTVIDAGTCRAGTAPSAAWALGAGLEDHLSTQAAPPRTAAPCHGPLPGTVLGMLLGHLSGPRAASHPCGTHLLWLLFPVAAAFIPQMSSLVGKVKRKLLSLRRQKEVQRRPRKSES